MIDVDAPLRPHRFPVPLTQRVRKIPTDTGQDDVLFEAMAFEVNHADPQAGDEVDA
jgi:hypothetical protein